MRQRKILLLAMMGFMAFASCKKEDVTPDPENPITDPNGNNGGTNSNEPSQALLNLNSNSIVVKDSASGDETSISFAYYFVESASNGQSAKIYVRENEDAYPSGNQLTISLTEGENNPMLSSNNKTYAYRTTISGTYPPVDEWQFRLCPPGGIADQGYDCYTMEYVPGSFYEIASETKMFYERDGDTHTFMFENHKVDNKTFMGKIEITNAEIGKPGFDSSEEGLF